MHTELVMRRHCPFRRWTSWTHFSHSPSISIRDPRNCARVRSVPFDARAFSETGAYLVRDILVLCDISKSTRKDRSNRRRQGQRQRKEARAEAICGGNMRRQWQRRGQRQQADARAEATGGGKRRATCRGEGSGNMQRQQAEVTCRGKYVPPRLDFHKAD